MGVLLLWLAVASLLSQAAQAQLSLSLRANWPSPPIALELLRASSSHGHGGSSSSREHELLSLLLENPLLEGQSDKEQYSAVLALATASEEDQQQLKLALAVNEHQPALIAMNALVKNAKDKSSSWLEYGGDDSRLSTVTELDTVVAQSSTTTTSNRVRLYAFDRPSLSAANTPLAILHLAWPLPLDPASPTSQLALRALSLARDRKLCLVLRYHWLEPNSGSTSGGNAAITPSRRKAPLRAWAAALDIKKAEYLVIDDRDQGQGQGQGQAAGTAEQVVLGQAGGAEERKEMKPVKKADLNHLGLYLVHAIVTSPTPFRTFTSLLSSFPSIAHTLTASHNPSVSLTALTDEVILNSRGAMQQVLPRGMRNVFFLNGRLLPTQETTGILPLLRLFKAEQTLLYHLTGIHPSLTRQIARRTLSSHPPAVVPAQAQGMQGEEAERFDASDRQERGKAVIWWNDVRRDRRYASFSGTLRDILRPAYPGSMPQLRHNLHTLILPMSPLSIPHLVLLTESVRSWIERGIPVRFGIVPLSLGAGAGAKEKEDERKAMIALGELVELAGRARAMRFLRELATSSSRSNNAMNIEQGKISISTFKRAYDQFRSTLLLGTGNLPGEAVELPAWEALGRGSTTHHASSSSEEEGGEGEPTLKAAEAYARRLGVRSEEPCAFINGAFSPLLSLAPSASAKAAAGAADELAALLQQALGADTALLQGEIYYGRLNQEGADERGEAETFFFDRGYKRRNGLIFPVEGAAGGTGLVDRGLKVVDLAKVKAGNEDAWQRRAILRPPPTEQQEEQEEEASKPANVTFQLVADFDSSEGRQLLREAIAFLEKNADSRVVLLHSPSPSSTTTTTTDDNPYRLSDLLYLLNSAEGGGLSDLLPLELLFWLDLELGPSGPTADLKLDKAKWRKGNPVLPFISTGADATARKEAEAYWREEMAPLVRALGVAEDAEAAVVVNGRVISPVHPSDFNSDDLKALKEYELKLRIDPVLNGLAAAGFKPSTDDAVTADVYELVSSVISKADMGDGIANPFARTSTTRRANYRQLHHELSGIVDDKEENALFELAVVVDPASDQAQKWAPLLETLSRLSYVHLRVYFNPSPLSEVPIKRYYASALSHEPTFGADGAQSPAEVSFDDLPDDVLFTLAMDMPSSWLAFPKESIHDLDNIRLSDLSPSARQAGVKAAFELENLIVEGHARELPTHQAPRGLQLELFSEGGDTDCVKKEDTIVMANLGYFQLKANPGLWELMIRQGRSSDVYSIESVGTGGIDSPSVGETGNELLVASLEGETIFPRFVRNPGFEAIELLDETAAPVPKKPAGGIIGKLASFNPFNNAGKPASAREGLAVVDQPAEINVFTMASGLLYERMAFLMVLSVLKHTESKVKFWFVSNFLSPAFKSFIPHLAREYKFDYQLVTYKWPHWLRPQTEKQRTIWGYKILFLDVLFPLELSRVIFVDSDQIVRTDLKQLVDLDLEGAPYAYAPMGDDRTEMEGFRFWKVGYWRDHLKGRPYHISALYVVDLDRFRQIAAGDRLRAQYQQLSADPNSLSNLDQDLPNNMQDSLPIYTLDQSWLWCETWCSDASLAEAKTIDLCNNPQTKEPKLARAKRLIPEWVVYDQEVADFARTVAAREKGALSHDAEEGMKAFAGRAEEIGQAAQQTAEREEHLKEQESKEEAAASSHDHGHGHGHGHSHHHHHRDQGDGRVHVEL